MKLIARSCSIWFVQLIAHPSVCGWKDVACKISRVHLPKVRALKAYSKRVSFVWLQMGAMRTVLRNISGVWWAGEYVVCESSWLYRMWLIWKSFILRCSKSSCYTQNFRQSLHVIFCECTSKMGTSRFQVCVRWFCFYWRWSQLSSAVTRACNLCRFGACLLFGGLPCIRGFALYSGACLAFDGLPSLRRLALSSGACLVFRGLSCTRGLAWYSGLPQSCEGGCRREGADVKYHRSSSMCKALDASAHDWGVGQLLTQFWAKGFRESFSLYIWYVLVQASLDMKHLCS